MVKCYKILHPNLSLPAQTNQSLLSTSNTVQRSIHDLWNRLEKINWLIDYIEIFALERIKILLHTERSVSVSRCITQFTFYGLLLTQTAQLTPRTTVPCRNTSTLRNFSLWPEITSKHKQTSNLWKNNLEKKWKNGKNNT